MSPTDSIALCSVTPVGLNVLTSMTSLKVIFNWPMFMSREKETADA